MVTSLLVVAGACFLAVAATMGVGAVAASRVGKLSVVDTVWGLGFVVVALVATAVGSALDAAGQAEGDVLRRWVLLAMVTVWGLRLARHMHRRNHGAPEDHRYAAMLGDAPFSVVLRRVFSIQGISLWFVALPVQVSAVAGASYLPVLVAGVALWVVGLVFEAVGDAQLAAYKRDPERGPVMDRGLWAWTRHPNYFGDACVWWGIFLVAASAWPGVLTVLSPIAMTYFLLWATGARLLERTMMRRPGYPEYAARTSMFVPWPPRRS